MGSLQTNSTCDFEDWQENCFYLEHSVLMSVLSLYVFSTHHLTYLKHRYLGTNTKSMSMLMNSVSLGCSLALVKLHIHMTVSLCVAIVH